MYLSVGFNFHFQAISIVPFVRMYLGKVREPTGLNYALLGPESWSHTPVCENPREKIIPLLH